MVNFKKIFIERTPLHTGSNLRVSYEIDKAAWVWHPELAPEKKAFVKFTNNFESSDEVLTCHLSGDQRYELYLDGELISRGPERSDEHHWSFSSYQIELSKGTHTLEAVVWNLGDAAPAFMETYQPGFIFKADGDLDEVLSTGKGEWIVRELTGWNETDIEITTAYHVVGSSLEFDGREWFKANKEFSVDIIRNSIWDNDYGSCMNGWRLMPATLPDMESENLTCGSIRAVTSNEWTDEYRFNSEDCDNPQIKNWSDLLNGKAVEIATNTETTVVWDLEEYHCAYAEIITSGGCDAVITQLWAEGLTEEAPIEKGNRNDVINKMFHGFGERFIADGGDNRKFEEHRWLSGRYILVNIKTADQPLTVNKLSINTHRYPFKEEQQFECDDKSISDVMNICKRVLRMCSHDSYVDCPYYEQLMYLGDTRNEILATFMMDIDERLPARAIELFDFSRVHHGFTTASFPARFKQLIPSFSLIYTWVVHDYLYWRGSGKWLRKHIKSVRSILDHTEDFLNEDGILGPTPGWEFIDWVPEWDHGWAPDGQTKPTAIMNLMFYMSLKKAADMERVLGESDYAARYDRAAANLGQKIIDLFFNNEKGLISDNVDMVHFSEHAQCLAILSGLYTGDEAEALFDKMLGEEKISKTTVYFKHYLFDTMKMMGRGDLILDDLDFWRGLKAQGYKTVPERPANVRSDCHAWGAHPIFHLHASVLGIRPTSPGFKTLEIKPSLGELKKLSAKTPHPNGFIETVISVVNEQINIEVTLPAGVSGTLVWRDKKHKLEGHVKMTL